MPCRHFHIRGQVQGVFFRASAREQALRLGLTGWVRNQLDGSVASLACGRAEALAEYERWLWQGPAAARVAQVSGQDAPEQVFDGFTTG